MCQFCAYGVTSPSRQRIRVSSAHMESLHIKAAYTCQFCAYGVTSHQGSVNVSVLRIWGHFPHQGQHKLVAYGVSTPPRQRIRVSSAHMESLHHQGSLNVSGLHIWSPFTSSKRISSAHMGSLHHQGSVNVSVLRIWSHFAIKAA